MVIAEPAAEATGEPRPSRVCESERNLAGSRAYEAAPALRRRDRKEHNETVDGRTAATYLVRPRSAPRTVTLHPTVSFYNDDVRAAPMPHGPARNPPGTVLRMHGGGRRRKRRQRKRVACRVHAPQPPPDADRAPGGFVSPRQTFCRNNPVRAAPGRRAQSGR